MGRNRALLNFTEVPHVPPPFTPVLHHPSPEIPRELSYREGVIRDLTDEIRRGVSKSKYHFHIKHDTLEIEPIAFEIEVGVFLIYVCGYIRTGD